MHGWQGLVGYAQPTASPLFATMVTVPSSAICSVSIEFTRLTESTIHQRPSTRR